MKSFILIISIFSISLNLIAEEINVDDIILNIEEKWNTIKDYTCIAQSYSKKGEEEEESTIEQKFLKPKWLRVTIKDGKGKGAVGIYNPKTKKVKGFKTGIFNFITLTLDLTDKRVASLRGHRIDQADLETVIERLRTYNNNEELTSVAKTLLEDKPAYLFTAEVSDTTRLWGAKKEKIWIDEANFIPLRVEQFTEDDEMMHFSSYSSIKTNIGLREEDFNP